MSQYTTYRLKVAPKDQTDIVRLIEVDGEKTLHELSSIILEAFSLRQDQLYMFSLCRKPYEADGYYPPDYSEGNNAQETQLGSLDLKVRRKILFLYDFKKEWKFDVTVSKVIQSEEQMETTILESQGVLVQEQNPEICEEAVTVEETAENVVKTDVEKPKAIYGRKIYPNELCPCGSGKKYKKCCKN